MSDKIEIADIKFPKAHWETREGFILNERY